TALAVPPARAPRVSKIDAFRDRVAELIALLLGLAHSTVACSTPVDPLRARLRLLILWDRTLRRCSSESPRSRRTADRTPRSSPARDPLPRDGRRALLQPAGAEARREGGYRPGSPSRA